MTCEAQICTTKSKSYEPCELEATHVSEYGHYYCETHRSPRDISISGPASHLALRMERRESVHDTKDLKMQDTFDDTEKKS